MILQRLCLFFSGLRKGLRIVGIEDYPEIVDENTFYVVGNLSRPQYALFKCPCGCEATIELNLNRSSRPCWRIKWSPLGTVSISPSINRKVGCQSHFFLTKSSVIWCK